MIRIVHPGAIVPVVAVSHIRMVRLVHPRTVVPVIAVVGSVRVIRVVLIA